MRSSFTVFLCRLQLERCFLGLFIGIQCENRKILTWSLRGACILYFLGTKVVCNGKQECILVGCVPPLQLPSWERGCVSAGGEDLLRGISPGGGGSARGYLHRVGEGLPR